MHSVILALVCLSTLGDIDDSSAKLEQERDGIKVKIECLEVSRFNGEVSSSLGVAASLVPKLKRAIVLTISITGAENESSPRLRLANGNVVGVPAIHGNTLRRDVQQVVSAEGMMEYWFEIESDLSLDQIFPCTVVVGAGSGDGEMIDFTFREISP